MRFWSPHWSTHKHCFCCYQPRCHLLWGNLKKAVSVRSCQPSNEMISLLSFFFFISVFPLAPRMRYSKMLRKKTGRLKPIHCATFQRITCVWATLFTHQSMYTSVLTENRGQWEQWTLWIQIFFMKQVFQIRINLFSFTSYGSRTLRCIVRAVIAAVCVSAVYMVAPVESSVSGSVHLYLH